MSAVPKTKLTPSEYLAIERKAEFKSEFYCGEMFAMAGANRWYIIARDNLAGELHSNMKGTPCRAYSVDMRIKVDVTGLYTYPDIAIVCGKPEFEDDVHDTLLNPRAIVEVLSESTEKYDRGAKFRHYRQIASLQEYVLVSQDEPLVERRVRQADGSWGLTEFAGLDGILEFASVPVRVPLSEIYRDVAFPEPSPGLTRPGPPAVTPPGSG
jgi:Uma2 family endonuclease